MGRRAWLAAGLLVCAASVADAHGGAYQPPPAPVRNGPLRGPTTGGPAPRGPVTPGGGAAPTTGAPGTGTPGSGAPETGTSSGGGTETGTGTGNGLAPTGNPGGSTGSGQPVPAGARGNTGLRVVDFNSVDWARWWFANRPLLLRWKARVAANPTGPVTPTDEPGTLPKDGLWRARAQSALIAALGDDSHSIASAAAVALGKSGDPSEAEALLRVLTDADRPRTVREGAALGLGLLPPDRDAGGDLAREALHDVAGDDDEEDRLRALAVYALGLRGDAASLPFLLETAGSGGAAWDVPAAGVAALGLAGDDMTLPDLLDLLEGPKRRRGREAVRRAYAAQALAMLGDVRAVPTLCAVALQDDEHARRASVLALGAIAPVTDERTTDLLLHLLANSRDVATRCVAALSLGRQGSPRAGPALAYAYHKGSLRLRPFAAISLGLLSRHEGLEGSTGTLLHDLRERASPELRAALCVSVGLAAEPRAVPALIEIVSSRDPAPLRAHAALALGLSGDHERAAKVLRQVLEDTREPELQREAALALGLLGDRPALRVLNDLVRHGGSAYVQGSAAVAIGRIGAAESVDGLIALLADDREPDLGRAMAAVGLGLLLDRDEGRRLARVAADLEWWLFTPTVLEVLTIH